MRRRRNLKRKGTANDSSAPGNDNIREEDIENLIKRLKLDVNDTKAGVAPILKAALKKLESLLDDLKQGGDLESYDAVGGYRYGYLLKNDINADLLVKVRKLDDLPAIVSRLKAELVSLVPSGNKAFQGLNVKLSLHTSNNASNVANRVVVLSFSNEGGRDGRAGKHRGRTRELFRLKLFFAAVKYADGKRKVNINEFILERLDDLNRRYPNVADAIVLAKLPLHNYNLTQTRVRFEEGDEGTPLGGELEERFIETGLNGQLFNLLAAELCVANNYSPGIKGFVLFRNMLKHLATAGIPKMSARTNGGSGFLAEIQARYPAANLFGHLELVEPQLKYFAGVFLGILGGPLSPEEKMNQLFLRRERMSNFYESYITFKSHPQNTLDKTKEITKKLEYGLGERLHLLHAYHIARRLTVGAAGPSHGNGDSNAVDPSNPPNYDCDYHAILYFAFDSSVQTDVVRGPVYGADREADARFQSYWGRHCKLYKFDDTIQQVVFLNDIAAGREGEADAHPKERGAEQGLELRDERKNLNLVTTRHILENVIAEDVVCRLGRLNVTHPLITEYHKHVVRSTNDLTDVLRGLEQLPLKILNINTVNEAYNYCNVYSRGTRPGDGRGGEEVTLMAKFESNSNWPLDDPEGMRRTKLSLLLAILKELRLRHGLEARLYRYHLLVEYNGIAYRLLLLTPKAYENPLGKDGGQSEPDAHSDELEELLRRHALGEMCRNAAMKNVGFVGCVRLCKIFFAKHLRVDADEAVKALCLGVYGEANPRRSSSAAVSFSQALHNVASGVWDNAAGDDGAQAAGFQLSDHDKQAAARVSRELLQRMKRDLLTVAVGTSSAESHTSSFEPATEADLVVSISNPYGSHWHPPAPLKAGDKVALIRLLVAALKTRTDGLAHVYYDKYRLLNYCNTGPSRTLELYVQFDRFKFVPRGHLRPQNFPQAVVVADLHLKHVAGLGAQNSLTSSAPPPPGLIVVPNVVLVLRHIAAVAKDLLYNIEIM